MKSIAVIKFGGSLVDLTGSNISLIVKRIIELKEAKDLGPLAIFSAPKGVTDRLQSIGEAKALGSDYDLDSIFASYSDFALRHVVGEQLLKDCQSVLAGLKNEVEKTLAKVDRRFDGVNRAKVLTSGGELPTAALMSYVLNSEAVHSCHLDKVLWPIITDDIFENATPDYEMSAKNLSGLLSLLEDGKVVTVGGFLGLTHDGLETVLGRGGSDQTAVFLSRLLSSHFAVETILFKDTPVQTADPSIVKDQPLERVPMMTYNEAQKATIAGMNIVQNAAVRIARSHNLTIMVAPLSNPTLGTMIQRDDTTNQTVKCVTGSRNCAIITMNNEKSRSLEDCLRLWEDYDGFLDLGAEVMDTGQVLRDFLILDANFVRKYEKQLRSFDKEMQVEYGVGIVTLVGDKMRTSPGIASKAIHSIPNINIKRGVFAPHTSQVILILNEADVPDAVRAIHSAIDIGISSN